jgi:hypothetical protein
MKVLVPTIEVRIEALELAPRPESLAGLKLGFLDSYASRGPDGRVTMYELMAGLKPLLEQRCELAGSSWTRKPNIAKAAEPAVIDAFAREVDVAVVGECASGSSVYATVHDAVELERRGVPTITICHHHLEPVARRHGRELGVEALPLLVEPAAANAIVPRPDEAFVRSAFVEVVSALTRMGGE